MILEKLTVALKNKYDTEAREGIHVSDLIYCPRKNAERRLNPRPITPRELNFFTSGRAVGDAIANLVKSNSEQFEAEYEVKKDGIVAHIDIYDKQNNIPIEVKSARLKEMKEPKITYVEQLKTYMSMVNADRGIILVQLLQHFDQNPFVEFEINMTKEEREVHFEKIKRRKERFAEALEKQDCMLADNVFEDQTFNWLCRDCPLYQKCEELF